MRGSAPVEDAVTGLPDVAAPKAGPLRLYHLPLLYLGAHAALILALPDQAADISLAFLIGGPTIAALACLWRASRLSHPSGWIAIAASMIIWSAGMVATLTGVESAGHIDSLNMLLFVLYGVPLIFILASPEREAWHVRLCDAVLALTLGYLFYEHVFAVSTMAGTTEDGLFRLRLMLDIENIFIALFSAIRLFTSTHPERRAFFRNLTIFACTYALTAGYINHFQTNVPYGTLTDLLIDLPFLLLTIRALRPPSAEAASPTAARRLGHLVRAASPLLLVGTLLAVAALLIDKKPQLAILGFVTASLGTGMRNLIVQLRSFQEQDRLDALSRIDALTRLPNRRQFDEALQSEWNRARRQRGRIALLMIDIDHFKLLNDKLGHPVGDDRLRAVGNGLATCARRGSDLAARYGGEEFAVILPGTDVEQASLLAETIRAHIADMRLPSPAPSGFITVSIGVAAVDTPRTDTPALLTERADTALYKAKMAGRNRVERLD